MTLEYRRECRQSNLLESLTTSSETLAEDSNSYNNRRPDLEFTHLLRMLADKAEIVRARTKWHSKQNQQEWYDLIHVHQLSLHVYFYFFSFFVLSFSFSALRFCFPFVGIFRWWWIWTTNTHTKKKKYWSEAQILLGMEDETFTKNLLFQSFSQHYTEKLNIINEVQADLLWNIYYLASLWLLINC